MYCIYQKNRSSVLRREPIRGRGLAVGNSRQASPLRPAVLLPGWFVEMQTKCTPEVWVLNPKMLRVAIEREPVILKMEDVAVVASRIVKDMQKL